MKIQFAFTFLFFLLFFSSCAQTEQIDYVQLEIPEELKDNPKAVAYLKNDAKQLNKLLNSVDQLVTEFENFIRNKIEIGIILLAVASLGLFLLNLPMAATLLLLFLSTLAMFYMWGGVLIFKATKEENSTFKTIGTVLIGLSIAISLIGVLFKLMRWPGASMQLTLGIYSLLIPRVICIIKFFN